MIPITRSISFDERGLVERFVRATGPGGQNVRKEATAVELRLDIGRAALPPDVKERLITLGGRHVTTDGVLVVVSRAHRSQTQNRTAARTRLVALLKRAARPPKARKATTPGPSIRDERLVSKQRHRALKRSRSGRGERE
jgi:ribosome-associated protein